MILQVAKAVGYVRYCGSIILYERGAGATKAVEDVRHNCPVRTGGVENTGAKTVEYVRHIAGY